MADNNIADIVLAAINATGAQRPDESSMDYQARLSQTAVDTLVMTRPGSEIYKRLEAVAAAKPFVATLVKAGREPSGRILLTLKTRPSENYPDGLEPGRTEFTNTPEGAAILAMLPGLKGHKVLVYLELQEATIKGQKRKVRVVRHLVDLGEDKEEATDAA